MKKITTFLILLISVVGFSQQQQYLLGFEPTTPSGVIANWVTFEGPAPAAEIVVNPDADGVNTSTTTNVLKLNMIQAGACYSGAINGPGTLGTWQLDAAITSNQTLTMQVNKNIVGKVGIKFVNATNGTVLEITDNQGLASAVNEWVTLSWNISGFNVGENNNISQFVVFIDWRCTSEAPRPGDVQLLVDNISWGANKLTNPATCTDGIQNGTETGIDCGGTCAPCAGQEPLVAAPTPPVRVAADVVSIFSNAYANVTLSELPTAWSQLTSFASVQIQTNDTWKSTGCEFIGMVTNYTTGVDLSTMDMMHIDYWTPNTNPIGVKIVNTVDIGEAQAPLGATVSGAWQSIDVPMTAFAALGNKTKITQLLIDPIGPSTIFIDNFYFYKTPIVVSDPVVAAPTPPARAAADVVSIFSNAYTNVTLEELPTSWSQFTAFTPVQIQTNDTWKITGCDFVGMVTNYAAGINLSAMETMHIDYWTPDNNPIGVKIVNTVDGGEALAPLGTTVTGAWQSIDVPMSAFAALGNKTKITQLLIDPVTPSKIYIDNFYFYKNPLAVSDFSKVSFSTYPNPTTNNWTVKSNSNDVITSVNVYDISGKTILNVTNTSNEVIINGSELSNGIYFATIVTDNGSKVIKLIKD